MSYSPHLKTAVLLTGNGTGGAYHAGVLRALDEAGVKVDVVAARGVGVVCALFAAIDAGAKTWEDGGVWRRRPPVRMYRWRRALQWATRSPLRPSPFSPLRLSSWQPASSHIRSAFSFR